MNTNAKQPTIYDLPDHILARVCQYLIDDPKLSHSWCSAGLIHVLSFRSTGSYFNQIIKTSFLRFFMCIDFLELSLDYENIQLKLMDSFLQWANSDLNWKCTELKFVLTFDDIESRTNMLLSNFIAKLLSFESVFSGKISYLNVYADGYLERYSEALTKLSVILSPDVVIELETSFADFQEVSDLPFAEFIKILKLNDEGHDHDLKLETVQTIVRNIPNVEKLMLEELETDMARALTSCNRLRQINCDFLSNLDNMNGTIFHHVEHFKVERWFGSQIKELSFSKVFPNLTSLTLDLAPSNVIEKCPDFILPPSCIRVKLDVCLVGGIINCPHIKHLAVIFRSSSDDMQMLQSVIDTLVFQLDIFVIESANIGNISNADCFHRIGRALLTSQRNLKALAIDLMCENSSGESGCNFYSLSLPEVSELEQVVKREQEMLEAHPSLQYMRIKDRFVVLKMSIDEYLVRLIKLLDTEFEWSIAQFDIPVHYDEFLAMRKSSLTII